MNTTNSSVARNMPSKSKNNIFLDAMKQKNTKELLNANVPLNSKFNMESLAGADKEKLHGGGVGCNFIYSSTQIFV